MKRNVALVLGIGLLSLLLMGCSLCSLVQRKGASVAQTAVATVQTQIASTVAAVSPSATPAGAASPEATAATGGGVEPGGATYQPLDALDSYRYQLDAETLDGGVKSTVHATGAYVKDPTASQLELQSQEGDNAPEVIKLIQVGGKSYLYDESQGGWLAMAYEDTASMTLDVIGLFMQELDSMLTDEDFQVVAAHETVNGVDCVHRHAKVQDVSTEMGTSDIQFTDGDVDLWVANEGDYLIRLVMNATGSDAEGQPAEAKFDMELFDVNKPVTVTPPPEDEIVQDLTIDLPAITPEPGSSEGIARTLPRPEDAESMTEALPDQAQAMVQGEDFDMYRTQLSVEDAKQFFLTAYPQQGWTKSQDFSVEGMAMLTFTKEGQTASVLVLTDSSGGGNIVVVTVQ
jgi:hypothetical protein